MVIEAYNFRGISMSALWDLLYPLRCSYQLRNRHSLYFTAWAPAGDQSSTSFSWHPWMFLQSWPAVVKDEILSKISFSAVSQPSLGPTGVKIAFFTPVKAKKSKEVNVPESEWTAMNMLGCDHTLRLLLLISRTMFCVQHPTKIMWEKNSPGICN